MSDADWKTKYLTALRSMEEDERRARDVEQALRRVVARLCLAAQGQDSALDAGLMELAAANKRNAGPDELSASLERLRDSLAAVDLRPRPDPTGTASATSAAPSATAAATAKLTSNQRWVASCEAAIQVLKQLARDDAARDFADTMIAELRRVETDAGFADILTRIADALQKRGDKLARDRQLSNSLLTEMAARLDEVTVFLTQQSDARQSTLDDAELLSRNVQQQVTSLQNEVAATNDLERLRAVVTERLVRIGTQAREYHARAESRFLEQSALAQKMTHRVAELERQSSELHRSLHREQKRARLDPLTGVPTRATFDEKLAEEIHRWKRFRSPVSVLVWDLDRFKSINDTYGHRAGDRVLQEVARCLSSRIRTTDVLARFGGEEFVMLLIGTPGAEAHRVADDLRQAIEAIPFRFHDAPVKVTTCCGVTELRDGDSPESVFDRADAALYKAKDGGRNLCIAA